MIEIENNLPESNPLDQESKEVFSKEPFKINCPLFDAFLSDFSSQQDIDHKIQKAMEFMEASLGGSVPRFRSFWEVRRLCLPLFKESGSSVLRNQIWLRYVDLSKEARRLKDQLDEQSAFAVEQIEIAIKALESDIERLDEIASSEKNMFNSSNYPKALNNNLSFYKDAQQKLNIHNAHAGRINALRKELRKTDMRIRQKNKFFQRLSAAGDKVFPPRKELILEVSLRFAADVNGFIAKHFSGELSKEPTFTLREEIKAFQGLAKVLTLNTSAFNQTRVALSECWDRLKQEDKLFKQEKAQQKLLFKQNAQVIREQLSAFLENASKNEWSHAESLKQLDAISAQFKIAELGRDELNALKKEWNDIRQPIIESLHQIQEARQKEEQERQEQRRLKYRLLKEQAENLSKNHELHNAEELTELRDLLYQEIQLAEITKHEKQEVERLLKPIKDAISEKREKAILAMSEDDLESYHQLVGILNERRKRRQEIKLHVEQLRKSAGNSGLDFEKAMSHQAQMQEEKDRLAKANQSVEEIEKKIAELQNLT